MTFTRLVRQAGLNKVELADRLGIKVNTVYAWKDSPPQYVIAYLEVLTEYNQMVIEIEEANRSR